MDGANCRGTIRYSGRYNIRCTFLSLNVRFIHVYTSILILFLCQKNLKLHISVTKMSDFHLNYSRPTQVEKERDLDEEYIIIMHMVQKFIETKNNRGFNILNKYLTYYCLSQMDIFELCQMIAFELNLHDEKSRMNFNPDLIRKRYFGTKRR